MRAITTPVSLMQFWLFLGFAAIFFAFLIRASMRKGSDAGAKRDTRSRLGIILQSIGIGLAGFGPTLPTLPSTDPAAIAGSVGVLIFMGGAIALFAMSSSALGKNWSVVARTLDDHELVRRGPYAYVRHPIYLGMLLFLLGLAVAVGHLVQLVIAVPVFLTGTVIRTRIEDRMLEAQFGETFRDYARSTPALIPGLR
jgi:protein-S-isoprenylcysteine O-methyltransferase Ste14